MASYTQITNSEASEILSLYGKGSVMKCVPLSLGISNSNYRVELENETLLLKISNDKNQVQLAEEQAILIYLSNCGFPFSLIPFRLKNGDFIYHYKQYFGVLYPFVNGIPPGPSDFTCQEVGKAIATLHGINHQSHELKKLRPHEEVGFGPQEILTYTQSPHCPEDFRRDFLELFPDQLAGYMGATFERGIIHGDLYYDNTLFDNNKLSTVLDFEQAGLGEYILDLGISISGTCLEKGRIISPLVNSFLLGYEQVRPLPKVEKKYLDQAIILGLFSISLWRIKRFKERNLNPLMENSYRDLLVRAKHFFEMRKTEN